MWQYAVHVEETVKKEETWSGMEKRSGRAREVECGNVSEEFSLTCQARDEEGQLARGGCVKWGVEWVLPEMGLALIAGWKEGSASPSYFSTSGCLVIWERDGRWWWRWWWFFWVCHGLSEGLLLIWGSVSGKSCTSCAMSLIK